MEKSISILLELLYFMLDAVIIHRTQQCMLTYKNDKYGKWGYMLLLYSMFLLNYVLLQIPALDILVITSIVSVMLYTGIFLLTQLFFEGKIGEKIVSVFVYIVMASTSELIVIIATTVIFQVSQIEIMENNSIFFPVMGSTKVLQLIGIAMIRRIKNKRRNIIQVGVTFEIGSILLLYLLLLIFTIIISSWYLSFIKNIQVCIVILFVLFLTITGAVVLIVLKLLKRREKELELKQHIREIELEKAYHDKIKEMETELRSLRHDMNNHMTVIKGLLYFEQYEELKMYFSEVNHDLERANQIPVLEEKALAVLLYEKIKKAEEAGIVLELELSREKSKIPSSELCALAGNLLDNAIEAVQEITEDKYIQFSFCVNEETTELCCENPYKKSPVEKEGKFFTTKQDKKNHGFGIQNMRKIVENHGGELKISHDADFYVHIILPHDTNTEKSGFLEQNRETGEGLYKYSEGR